ncbi:hypothetical protein B1207_12405 [Legionella quinlivanii]|uniref:HTH luxR-type domain-containing protein n=1 Tax=Legionella quinlivanii TaxID=45073 RepID=A0A364LH14_9GAMM|nr:helix-turn-helix transcriptional regulator [Legionella quinlivanii]RAP35493.1 hypothetical protein B1207_12405 [Legionella quinlivanii]
MKPYFPNSIELNAIGVAKHQNGLMLYNMENKSPELLLSFADLFDLPYSVYLLDARGATVKINEIGAAVCGYKSPEQAVGKTIFDVSTDSARHLLDNCESILKQETIQFFDEFNTRLDGKSLQFLSVKFPCYDSACQLQGTLGISIVLGEHSLADAIMRLTDAGLLPEKTSDNPAIKLNLEDASLTPREQECLEYTVKGFTAKEIARVLSISPRTVEEYINQVKIKLGVSTKREMIQKVLDV